MSNCRRAKLVFDSFHRLTSRINVAKDVTLVKPVWRRYSSTFLRSKFTISLHNPFFVGVGDQSRWLRRLLYVFGSGVVIDRFFFETIPYSNRTHFVIMRPSWDKKLGEHVFECMKDITLRGKSILPATHPQTIRIRHIANNITEALQRRITLDQNKNKSRWQQLSTRVATSHLDGKKWEIIVVDDPVPIAYSLSDGKILVFTGLLHTLKHDDEIAWVIGHEVAHFVARHTAEEMTKGRWILLLQSFFSLFFRAFGYRSGFNLFPKLSEFMTNLSRRMELEADYIGLLLLASAGYDPRFAPGSINILGDLLGKESNDRYPSVKERAEKMAQAHVMEEALSMCRTSRINGGT